MSPGIGEPIYHLGRAERWVLAEVWKVATIPEAQVETFPCPYCNKPKPVAERTTEHVFPKALGGALERKPLLLLDTCRPCNVACGRHVDGPFIRSWLTGNARAAHGLKYCDLSRSPVLPLTYIGPLPDVSWEGNVCEMWLGPTGDVVYHFHGPYPRADEAPAVVGEPLNARREEIDPGFVVLFIQATNPAWHPPIVLSVMEHFEDSVIYFGNSNPPRGGHPRLKAMPDALKPLHATLLGMNGKEHHGKEHHATIALDLAHGERFIAKLALGFGALFLAPSFLASDDARQLRNYLWERDRAKRADLLLHGSGFLGDDAKPLADVLGWPAGHVFVFQPLGDVLGFSGILYGTHVATVAVSNRRDDWVGRIDGDGSVFLVAPGIRRGLGLVPLSAYVAARHSPGDAQDAAVVSFLAEGERQYPLPPRHL